MSESSKLINGTCPECRGPLTEVRDDGQSQEYVCLVGHRYSARALLQAHSEAQERTLWSAVVALEEAANLVREVVDAFPPEIARHLVVQAEKKGLQAEQVREVLRNLDPFQV